jgi:hypothetical protein
MKKIGGGEVAGEVEVVRRLFGRSGLGYSTATMDWPGNYDTRVSRLMKLGGPLVHVAAAFGDDRGWQGGS